MQGITNDEHQEAIGVLLLGYIQNRYQFLNVIIVSCIIQRDKLRVSLAFVPYVPYMPSCLAYRTCLHAAPALHVLCALRVLVTLFMNKNTFRFIVGSVKREQKWRG